MPCPMSHGTIDEKTEEDRKVNIRLKTNALRKCPRDQSRSDNRKFHLKKCKQGKRNCRCKSWIGRVAHILKTQVCKWVSHNSQAITKRQTKSKQHPKHSDNSPRH